MLFKLEFFTIWMLEDIVVESEENVVVATTRHKVQRSHNEQIS